MGWKVYQMALLIANGVDLALSLAPNMAAVQAVACGALGGEGLLAPLFDLLGRLAPGLAVRSLLELTAGAALSSALSSWAAAVDAAYPLLC